MKSALFLLGFCAFLALAPREPWSGAAQLNLATARSLAHGSLDVAAAGPLDGTHVHRGRRYARTPAAALPLLPAALVAGNGDTAARAAQLLGAAAAAAAAALTLVVFFGNLRRLGTRPGAALWGTALLGACTGLLVEARVPDGTALAALLLTWALGAGRQFARAPAPRRALALGAACALVGVVEPTLLPAAGVIVIAAVLRAGARGSSAALWMMLPLVVGGALGVGYQRALGFAPEPTGDLLQGLDGLLLSTGKSVLLYNPPLVLAAAALPWWWRTRRREAAVTLAVLVAGVWAAARLAEWHGDVAWGPRRLVPLLPVALEPIALWLEASWARLRPSLRALAVALALAGAGVQMVGAALPPETFVRVVTMVKNGTGAAGWFAAPDACHFIPQFSPLQGQPWLIAHALKHDRNLSVDPPWTFLIATTPRLDRDWPLLRVDWWAAAWPWPAATALLMLLVAAAIVAAVRLFGRLVVR
jgi:hypothetical protein